MKVMIARFWDDFKFPIIVTFIFAIFIAFLLSVLEDTDFPRADRFVEACLQSEKYTREECIIMAGDQ